MRAAVDRGGSGGRPDTLEWMQSTRKQVGCALGVAVTGVLFFGAHSDLGRAFEISLVQLTVLVAAIGAASRLLPERRRGPASTAAAQPIA